MHPTRPHVVAQIRRSHFFSEDLDLVDDVVDLTDLVIDPNGVSTLVFGLLDWRKTNPSSSYMLCVSRGEEEGMKRLKEVLVLFEKVAYEAAEKDMTMSD